MDDVQLMELAKVWIELQRAEEHSSTYDTNFWAHEKLDDMCERDPENCWKVIHMARALDTSDHVLSNLAAGPLEDLLVRHGDGFIERVENLARQDHTFRRMLGAVWQNDMKDSVWQRIKAIADAPW